MEKYAVMELAVSAPHVLDKLRAVPLGQPALTWFLGRPNAAMCFQLGGDGLSATPTPLPSPLLVFSFAAEMLVWWYRGRVTDHLLRLSLGVRHTSVQEWLGLTPIAC